jgi:hypothetical protein
MKKHKIILGIIVYLFVVGCKDSASDLQTIDYGSHSFILYDGGSYAGGILHNPDCKCLKGKNNQN